MSQNSSDRFMIENEKIMRKHNVHGKNALKKYFPTHNDLINTPLAFHCECSDLNCDKNISLTMDEYEKIHKRRDRFCIYKGHEKDRIEKIVNIFNDYIVVEKFALAAN